MSDDIFDDEPDNSEDGGSGPFCSHWSEPCDCDELCICGHQCKEHSIGDECFVDGCDCVKFTDANKE